MYDPYGPDDPPACLPDEEPLVDLDTFERAGQALVSAAPDGEPAD